MEEVSRIDKTNLTQLSFLILLYLLVTWGSQQQNKGKKQFKTQKREVDDRRREHRRKDNTIHKNKKRLWQWRNQRTRNCETQKKKKIAEEGASG